MLNGSRLSVAVPAADVVLIPVNRHARTDSVGRFEFRSLDDGVRGVAPGKP